MLAAFPLFVLNKFAATHNKGRMLDYAFCNTVAKRALAKFVRNNDTVFPSDHVAL
jgi:hypothetical protein